MPTQPLFDLGKLLGTPAALAAMERTNTNPADLLLRHAFGDWGDVDAEDKLLNDADLKRGGRLLSVYTLSDSTKLWVITEAANDEGKREATTILLPEEY